MKIQQFKFKESGLNRFFGPLEAKVMECIWHGKQMTIKDVQIALEKDKIVNFNTVMTVMNRLVEKGLLDKYVKGRVSVYQPVLSQQEFLEGQSKELTSELIDEFGLLAVSHMLDAVEEADEELLLLLEQKIKKLKASEEI
ncbi:BlaI/MecI/CopY family transcriptional regulator [Priestia flexa]|jgi:predicted transcriptional regulator|uniref:Transcriptional regulator n=2 Tax=Priestia TaxID=2800373 RepID=A0A0V8JMZ9_9BACI|nr:MULTISPECIES: BlaI/MecI/CopY family transcriptional regulator [Bacillaceae]KSU88385.1 transcriptional regulator [Priestia veravalensis]KZB91788.1 transcriptional regulator [Bacillus sp. VT 712]MBN8251952.1 BlaI/MecI/CopY family transcriptional regulator [Priestia flexa]MBN8435454.1 BlaI/MecI/CopY family transcriptional regulator [Priestia flexa]MBY6085493.1 BlaI/MecI/CopY family transcriptional regulator [Priestia flexa]